MNRYIVENKENIGLIKKTRLRKHMMHYSDKDQNKRPQFGVAEICGLNISAVYYFNPDINMDEPSEVIYLSPEVFIPFDLWADVMENVNK